MTITQLGKFRLHFESLPSDDDVNASLKKIKRRKTIEEKKAVREIVIKSITIPALRKQIVVELRKSKS